MQSGGTLVVRRPDQTLGRYELRETIGRGGMGEVWLARRDGTGPACVVKRLARGIDEASSTARRFQREAHLAAFLDHPGVARTLDAGFDHGGFYIAMEYIGGVDLADVVRWARERRESLPVPLVVGIARQVLAALSYVHDVKGPDGEALEIVHRDLAPKNLMLTFDGRTKVIDFGVARARLGDFETRSDILIGTAQYFSPEQAEAQRVDRRSDLYSFAAVLFELLVGRPLVDDLSLAQVLEVIAMGPVPSVASMRDDVPAALDRAIARGLVKAPRKRFASAAAFLEAIGGLEAWDEGAIGAWVRERFPAAYERSKQYQGPTLDDPVAWDPTRYEAPLLSMPTPVVRAPKRSPILAAMLLAIAAVALAIAVQRGGGPAPLPPRQAPPPRASASPSPSVVDRRPPAPPPAEPVDPPPVEPAPRPRARPPKKSQLSSARQAVMAALAAKALDARDLAHQHHLPEALRMTRALQSGDVAAIEEASAALLPVLERVDRTRSSLRRRLKRRRAERRLKGDASADREILDLAPLVAGDAPLRPEEFRALCARIDAL